MVKIRWTEGLDGFDEVYQVRKEVFIGEQDIPEELEIDPIATHITIFDKNKPIAIGRLFKKNDMFYIGRVCVISNSRDRGFGRLVMKELIKKGKHEGAIEMHLSSRIRAMGFYKKFGFCEYEGIHYDAGIAHIGCAFVW
ncbi:GNAT family N-acetyltransferase [Methanohalophilus halophilus]|uniref:Predicted N-acyltransferase, GNAT family n=1 Tax=Methanohalophilus halophilus TaxID=2177 RepID=A0A1H2SB34_9EURY|nr:GNAT family N-acetyltransferase [Methanohalophilus halophilus]SDW28871.1 Predicted N-acyltransferase, GNAT family [Methanohalophilus halophilus]